MPYKYVLELVADYLAAGRTYMGSTFTFEYEHGWWKKKRDVVEMHDDTKCLISNIFCDLCYWNFDEIDWKRKGKIYEEY